MVNEKNVPECSDQWHTYCSLLNYTVKKYDGKQTIFVLYY